MFDKKLFLSHFAAKQNGANQGQNYDRVVVDSQGVRWGFDQKRGIYENLNTGQRMNSILFENTNLSNAAAASDASSGWGVSNRSSDVNTPEIQALLTKKGGERGKDFRHLQAVLGSEISVIVVPETFFPLDAVFYGRIQGPYFDDTLQADPTNGPGPQWRTTGGRNKVYFNPTALLGSTYANLDNPGSGHLEVQSFKTWANSSGNSQKVTMEVVFGTTSDAKRAWEILWGGNTGAGGTAIYYAGTTGSWSANVNISQQNDREGRAVFYSRIATSGKTLAMMGGPPNEIFATDPTPESAFKFFRAETSPPGAGYASTWRTQLLGNNGGWFDYDAWVSAGQAGSTAELLSRTLFIPMGSANGVFNAPNYGHYPLSAVFSSIVHNGTTGYNSILGTSPFSVGNVPYENNWYNMMINNPNGAGSTTPFSIEFAFFKGTAGSTAGLIDDWASYYGVTGTTQYGTEP